MLNTHSENTSRMLFNELNCNRKRKLSHIIFHISSALIVLLTSLLINISMKFYNRFCLIPYCKELHDRC